MASIQSNSADVLGSVGRIANALRLDDGRRLGRAVVGAASNAIVSRTKGRQVDPDGAPLAKLSKRYAERKAALGLDPRILVATDEMMTPGQVEGEVTVSARAAEMTAGLDAETQAKVDYAHAGGGNRPKRPFYDLGADGAAAVDDVIVDAINQAAG